MHREAEGAGAGVGGVFATILRAESRKQKAESRKQKAEGRKQKAASRKQKAATIRGAPLLAAFCLLPSGSCRLLYFF